MQKIKTRNELPLLLNDLNLNGKGIEIGVERGEYSYIILKHSNLSILYSVDAWTEMSKEEYQDINNHSQEKHNQNKKETKQRLSKYKNRSKILHKTSKKASKLFKDNELDFIYIDANHSYHGCKEDIELWYPKVKVNGILAGHDYILDGHYSEGIFGVKSAVDEFVKKYNLKLFTTKEIWTSWYIKKLN